VAGGDPLNAHDRIFTPTGALRAGSSLLLSLLGIALALGLTIAYVQRVDDRREQSARQAQEAQRRAGEQVKAAVCSMILANVRVYDETPPQTLAGKNLADSWDLLSRQFGC
jgi:type II secretory pathway pseudopilin PulG